MCYDLVRQQFTFHSQAPVLNFGNRSALHLLGNRQLTNDIWMKPDARQKPLIERLIWMILFVGGGWLLRSKPMCDWRAKRQRISTRKEAVNGPHNRVLRTCEIPKKRADGFAIAEGKGHCVLRRG
jgi:hypothetical protein